MKKSKVIIAAAVAVVILASVVAVGVFKTRGDVAEPSTATTAPSTTLPVITESETWFDWDAYVSSMNLTASDPNATAALSDIVSSVDPSGAAGVTVPGGSAVPTSIVYVLVDPSNWPQYVNPDTNPAQPQQPQQPQQTQQQPTAAATDNTTGRSDEMIDYQYTLDTVSGTVRLDKYLGSEKNPQIPATVNGYKITEIGTACFKGKPIEGVYISKNIAKIGNSAFSNCKKLINVWFTGKQAVAIGNYAFEDCTALSRIVLSANTTSIGDGCFANCKSLKKIYLPPTVTEIGVNPFSGCADGFYIECVEGSIAHQKAEQYGMVDPSMEK